MSKRVCNRAWVAMVAIVAAMLAGCGRHEESAADTPAGVDSAEPIVVGILVSHFSATGPSYSPRPRGYDWPTRIHEDIVEYGTIPMEIVGVIDPGTGEEDGVVARLEEMGVERVIEATDAAEMDQLDVIVLGAKNNLHDEVLDSILAAAELRGVGVWNVCITGLQTPGWRDPRVAKLWGGERGRFVWAMTKVAAEVVAEHPVIEGVELGTLVGISPSGMLVNPSRVTPLLQVDAEITAEWTRGRLPEGTRFAPLYVGRIGKARIVCLGTPAQAPDRLHRVTDGQFVNNTLTWLAKGKRETAGTSSTSP